MFEGKTGGQIGLVKGCAGSVVAAGHEEVASVVSIILSQPPPGLLLCYYLLPLTECSAARSPASISASS